jgi:hypothetical protein
MQWNKMECGTIHPNNNGMKMCPIYSILYYKIKPGKNTNIHGSFEFAFT